MKTHLPRILSHPRTTQFLDGFHPDPHTGRASISYFHESDAGSSQDLMVRSAVQITERSGRSLRHALLASYLDAKRLVEDALEAYWSHGEDASFAMVQTFLGGGLIPEGFIEKIELFSTDWALEHYEAFLAPIPASEDLLFDGRSLEVGTGSVVFKRSSGQAIVMDISEPPGGASLGLGWNHNEGSAQQFLSLEASGEVKTQSYRISLSQGLLSGLRHYLNCDSVDLDTLAQDLVGRVCWSGQFGDESFSLVRGEKLRHADREQRTYTGRNFQIYTELLDNGPEMLMLNLRRPDHMLEPWFAMDPDLIELFWNRVVRTVTG